MTTQNLRQLKVIAVVLSLILALPVNLPTAFANHRDGHEQGNGNGNGNNGNGNGNENNGNGNNGNNGGGNGNQGQADHGNRASARAEGQRHHETVQAARNAEVQRSRDDRKTRENRPDRPESRKSENAKWWRHPSDTRGQGNMGQPRMLNPYGHDKDSDRKELYGNNGRPIREKDDAEEPLPVEDPVQEEPVVEDSVAEEPVVEEPPLVEEPIVEEPPVVVEEPLLPEEPTLDDLLAIDFSALGSENEAWMETWFDNVIASYSTNTSIATIFTYDQWYQMWYDHFFPEGRDNDTSTGIRMGGTRDELDFTISGDWGSEPLQVTTTLIAAEDFSGYRYIYDAATRTFKYEYITITAGDVMQETTQEAVLDPVTGSVSLSTDVDDATFNFLYGDSYSIDFSVTVTDPTTGSSTTSTYDSALFLFRCPYGKVYNKLTNEPIVGAKVTVFFEDGSIVPLDKALNPTASNPQYSDATGRYGCKLQTGRTYYIEVTADGYEPYRSEPFTEKWHVLREDLPMTPLKTESPEIAVPELPDTQVGLKSAGEPMKKVEAAIVK